MDTKKASPERSRRVFVAMSGGVDSSVAAFLLKEQGYDVTGAHMTCWEGCDSNEDRRDAMRVAAKLGIPFHVFDFKEEYKEGVFNYMIREYASGRTPNPDVICNSEIKFGIFLEKAISMGADFIATGHYARVKNEDSRFWIHEAKDRNKDQTYFLWRLTQDQLSRALFPIGDYLKSEVREIAKKAGLITADKKDSQGLCFVGKVDFQDFLREYLPKNAGSVVNSGGKVLGTHDGAYFFTPGQRHGIKLGGHSEPLYVAETNKEKNTIIVAEGASDPVLYKKEIFISGANLPDDIPEKISTRIRYRQTLQACSILKIENSKLKIVFDSSQRAVAPGQSVVFYSGERLLGGGIIEK
ncbi:tRNA 2-thiouridine(34) synthase MnmA [Candidatus Giovannonibacteria bacterium RIFCSPLOWO2_02_FULL_45_14]|uniref:tRNA-specific 2-thiouridylase MnmA n=1 Tax=Candidatus Giovannonibacteria bacterium RIFCSPLOWO2_12_FULL_44_15 TaxID=1798364 RepID=A0A1F5Y0X2_9BACT|nr:MAG: tRNA 2-thiouridine(34) synthase MnmA [Candidatus Giovannonibacteria bacterium RIFCSPHIGHO2_02_FULL_44_31]OGF77022.1 MAG: tRNA 2-thiouridine(34) synthase MnmA [Candidatus Giovannonibacteria bacterium RIFCSPHIGHO2_12_FULL_44_29]OGF90800.1 MAG: tRNA 2-thiouridine(34) synthase MnmA [Candidatus Giovannonibacteria bacterium RIFCSPLOWO2_02_FULL_45_14]OGF93855.1 MAG: tRNA 2-thiouridine(34) synthase MnmA [Candidatus Giovannonibacteria bacterium RIFCSPLOWO2_12_FULL_44_15]